MIRTLTSLTTAAILLSACGGGSEEKQTVSQWDKQQAEQQAERENMTRFETLVERCGAGELGDSGRTVVVTMLTVDLEAGCVLDGANLPDSVIARMESTRALDGTQVGEWEDTKATWTYSPSDGLNVILEDLSEQ